MTEKAARELVNDMLASLIEKGVNQWRIAEELITSGDVPAEPFGMLKDQAFEKKQRNMSPMGYHLVLYYNKIPVHRMELYENISNKKIARCFEQNLGTRKLFKQSLRDRAWTEMLKTLLIRGMSMSYNMMQQAPPQLQSAPVAHG